MTMTNSKLQGRSLPSKKPPAISSPVLIEAWYEGVHYLVSHEPDGTRRMLSPLPATTAALLAPPIAFNRAYVKVTRSLSSALMLSHAVGEGNRLQDDSDGWFTKTTDEWHAETGLSRHEQITARRVLKELGVMAEKLAGQPARLHFRVDHARIYDLIHGTCDDQLSSEDLSASMLMEMFGDVIAVNRAYIHLTGHVAAGVFLSFLQETIDSRLDTKAAGGFIMPLSELLRRTGLSMFELCSARKMLAEMGFATDHPPETEADGHVWLLDSEQVELALQERSANERMEIEEMAKLIGLLG